ncbi:MAG: AgmX/PglI C-terminal domain-containing protein [Polyangiaceae bacterium]|jgi:hypothetical protein
MTPSSRPPAGLPRSSGSLLYAGVALLLLAGIVALWSWRRMGAARAPVATTKLSEPAASASPSVENPKLEDIPPPPPVVASTAPAPPRRAVVAPASLGCDGTCIGREAPGLEPALRVRANQARRCYDRALLQDSTLRGHVTILVRVGTSGAVCSATVTSNDMATPDVANCAANIFRSSGTLPAPRGGCIEAPVPLSFVPQGQ